MLRNLGKGIGVSVATFAADSLFGDEIEKEVKKALPLVWVRQLLLG